MHAGTSCVHVEGSGTALLRRCTISWAADEGIEVCQRGSQVVAESCVLTENTCGVCVGGSGASFKGSACKASGHKFAGYTVQKDASMELTDCSSTQDERGCTCELGGRLTAVRTDVEASKEAGIVVFSGGHATLTGCQVLRGRDRGVWVRESRSKASMTGCTVEDTQLNCVTVDKGAAAVLKTCVLSKSKTGSGLFIMNAGSHVAAEDCAFEHNARSGAYAAFKGLLAARVCRSSGNKRSGFLERDRGCIELSHGCVCNGRVVEQPALGVA